MASVDPKTLAAEAFALKAAGRLDQAIVLYRQAVDAAPRSVAAEHNLAGALGDAGRWREAAKHIERAFVKGADAPESWLVRARCLQSLGQFDGAEAAYSEAVRRRATLNEALSERAQLRWMRTGDLDAALRGLEGDDPRLALLRAKVLDQTGHAEEALALLRGLAGAYPSDIAVLIAASHALARAGSPDALQLAQLAFALAPDVASVALSLAAAWLATGAPDRALELIAPVRARAPNDQYAIVLQATAWRMQGDARYRALFDYAALVQSFEIDTPPGWANLSAYLTDLETALTAAHAFMTHPFDQSIRGGSQVASLLDYEDAAIAALPQALDGPIRRYLRALGVGDDPIRVRNTGGYAFQGLWSIRTRTGGYHVDHVHPQGWISSACYIALPHLNANEGQLKFGEAGIRTTPALSPELQIAPAPGKLVLFPSYMWHGTTPFADDAPRLTIAFDLLPA